jgi:hypothetical protein
LNVTALTLLAFAGGSDLLSRLASSPLTVYDVAGSFVDSEKSREDWGLIGKWGIPRQVLIEVRRGVVTKLFVDIAVNPSTQCKDIETTRKGTTK